MHIPDAALSMPVWAAMNVISIPSVGLLAKRAQQRTREDLIPLPGVMGTFVFAAQMVNFPVGVGVSGHLVGGTLLAATLGPAAAAVVMTAVLVIQAFIFQDGGVLALGANIFNMALMGVFAGYLPYHLLGQGRWRTPALFAGGVLSVVVSSSLALSELVLSGIPLSPGVSSAAFALFGANALLEGLITVLVVQAIERMNPGWVQQPQRSWRGVAVVLGSLAIGLSVGSVWLSSSAPDTLEHIGAQVGMASQALLAAPFPDYATPGATDWWGRALPGLLGLAAIAVLCWLFARFMVRRRT